MLNTGHAGTTRHRIGERACGYEQANRRLSFCDKYAIYGHIAVRAVMMVMVMVMMMMMMMMKMKMKMKMLPLLLLLLF